MAEEDKKKWYERAWDWRTKNIAEPIRSTRVGGALGEFGDRYIRPAPESLWEWGKNIPQKSNIKDSAKIFGNYLDWERRMLGAIPRTLPRSLGFDLEFYNPFSAKEEIERKKDGLWDFSTIIPGIDFKGYDQNVMGVGGIDDLMSTTIFNENLNLTNEDSAASKFLQQYDNVDAFHSYINDNITEDRKKEIGRKVDREFSWNNWAAEFPYNDPKEYDALWDHKYDHELRLSFLDSYMKEVGGKYKDRMIDEFGAYDIYNTAVMKNLGFSGDVPMTNEAGDEFYAVDNKWLNAGEDRPYFPEEFNFGALDPIANELFADFPFEYDEKEHYEHPAPNIGVGLLTGGGILAALRNMAMRLPKHMQTALKVAHPSTSQLGFGSKNARWFARDYPTIRGIGQTILAPVVSENFKQRDWYPDEY